MANIPPVHVKLVPYRVGTHEGFRPVPDKLTTLGEDEFLRLMADELKMSESALRAIYDRTTEKLRELTVKQYRVNTGSFFAQAGRKASRITVRWSSRNRQNRTTNECFIPSSFGMLPSAVLQSGCSVFDMALGSFMVLRMEGEGIHNIIIPHFGRNDKGGMEQKVRKTRHWSASPGLSGGKPAPSGP